MAQIVSVSRRTDVPAFYAEWFRRRLEQGLAGWENPFGRQKYLVSLKREDVLAFVFWSKNFRPFLPVLREVKRRGFPCLFHYTITGLPRAFECGVVEPDDAVDSLKEVSRLFTPEAVIWRYDPIVMAVEGLGPDEHRKRFEALADRLTGFTTQCYLSYAALYGKVARNFKTFTRETGIRLYDPPNENRIALAHQLAEIARHRGIQLFSCCGDYLVGDGIQKGHCVDGALLSDLYFDGTWKGRKKPSRKECGCTESVDIGQYDTCPHGCIYCYANINKRRADTLHACHDPDSLFLGYTQAESDRFVEEGDLTGAENGKFCSRRSMDSR